MTVTRRWRGLPPPGDAFGAGGLQSLSAGQFEAARTQGFSAGQALRFILLPQALRNAAVAGGDFINLLKDTSLAFIVNVPELTTVAGREQPGADLPAGDFRFHRRGLLPAVLRPEPAGKPPLYRA